MKPKDYTIMIVDDDEKILGSLERTFARLGYNVLVAKSGEEGLNILRTRDAQLIISDIRMPVMAGVGFLEKAKEIVPDAVRIVITGYADIQAAADAINDAEVFKFILKPWDRYHLEKIVKQALEHYNTVRENRRRRRLLAEQNRELAGKADTAAKKAAHMEKEIAELKDRLNKIYAKYPDEKPPGEK